MFGLIQIIKLFNKATFSNQPYFIGHQPLTFLGKTEILAEDKYFNLEHIFKMIIVLEVDIPEFFKEIET